MTHAQGIRLQNHTQKKVDDVCQDSRVKSIGVRRKIKRLWNYLIKQVY